MSSTDGKSPKEREHTRVSLETRVDLVYESVEDFVSEQSENIGEGGIFVTMLLPPPVGTGVTVGMRLRKGLPLVRGRGEVVWTRPPDDTTGQPAGMGIRFLELDEKSLTVIRKVVEQRLAKGEEVFDIESQLGVAEKPRPALAKPEGTAVPLPFPEPSEVEEQPPPAEAEEAGERAEPPPEAVEEAGEIVESPPEQEEEESTEGAGSPATVVENAADTTEETGDDDRPTEEEPSSKPSTEPLPEPEAAHADGRDKAADKVAVQKEVVVPQTSWDPVDFVPDEPKSRRLPRGPVVLAVGALALVVVVVAGIMLMRGDAPDTPVQHENAADAGDADAAVVEPAPESVPVAETSTPSPGVEADVSPPPPPAATGPATRVEHITWRETDSGSEIEIRTDGLLSESLVRHGWMADPPRYLLRFIGIREPYDWLQAETSLTRVPQIRIGLHADRNPPQLHVVLDLGKDTVRISAVRIEGSTVTVVLGG